MHDVNDSGDYTDDGCTRPNRPTEVRKSAEPERVAGLRAHDPELMRALSDILKDKPAYREEILTLAETMRKERNINHKDKARAQIREMSILFGGMFAVSCVIAWIVIMADMSVHGPFVGVVVMCTWLATMGFQYAFVREMDTMNSYRTWTSVDAHNVNGNRIMFVLLTGAALFLEWALIVTTKDPTPDDPLQNLAVGLTLIAMVLQLFFTLSPVGVGVVFFEHRLKD